MAHNGRCEFFRRVIFSPECVANHRNQSSHQLAFRFFCSRPPLLRRFRKCAFCGYRQAPSFGGRRRINNAGDVSARRQHKTHLAAQQFAPHIRRLPRHNVVFFTSDNISRCFNGFQATSVSHMRALADAIWFSK